jgi:hypothetical protein
VLASAQLRRLLRAAVVFFDVAARDTRSEAPSAHTPPTAAKKKHRDALLVAARHRQRSEQPAAVAAPAAVPRRPPKHARAVGARRARARVLGGRDAARGAGCRAC